MTKQSKYAAAAISFAFVWAGLAALAASAAPPSDSAKSTNSRRNAMALHSFQGIGLSFLRMRPTLAKAPPMCPNVCYLCVRSIHLHALPTTLFHALDLRGFSP
jgi:hypothetical protein